MPFEKGKSGNPAGRKTGTLNTINRDLRERITSLLEEQFEQVAADLKGLEPKSRVEAWLKLLEFALPKLQRSEIDAALSVPEADNRPVIVLDIAYRGDNGPLKLSSTGANHKREGGQ